MTQYTVVKTFKTFRHSLYHRTVHTNPNKI